MNRQLILCGFWSLLCLTLAACGTLEVARQEEEALDQVAVEESTATAGPETDTPVSETRDQESVPGETATAEITSPQLPVTETESVVDEESFYARKTGETLILPGCYDFDGGASVVPPDTACDFSMLPGPDSGTVEIYPQAGAQLAYGGVFPEVPTRAQCAESDALSADREIVAPLSAMYICYLTGEGRTGYLHFTAAELEEAGRLTFDWLTFASEDSAAPDREGLAYRSEEFGFQLALPPAWSGFRTTQNDHEEGSNICFNFTGSAPYCVLQIDVWQKAAWDNLEKIPDGYYLGENDLFVFAAGPYPAECVQMDDFLCARHTEIPAILAGFRVE